LLFVADMSATVDTVDTVQVMLRQEAEYATTALRYPTDIDPTTTTTIIPVDASVRGQMAEWCCQVVRFCRLEIEVVFITMNYADRMCAVNPRILRNRAVYQRVVTAALYSAAKIHAQEALGPNLVSHLSNGTYTEDDIENQERSLLSALQWRLNPPTPHSFVHQYMTLYGPILSPHERHAVTHFALQQIDEYGVQFHCCTTVRESVLAYCAVLNALERLPLHCSINEKALAVAGYNLARLIGIDASIDKNMISGAKFVLLSHFPSVLQHTHSVPLSPTTTTSAYSHPMEAAAAATVAAHKRIYICEPEVEVIVRRD
jgi:Cyclin, N-terminal domain